MAADTDKKSPDPDLGDDAGAPIADDAIDPELIALPRPRPRVGFATSLSVVVLSAFLLVKLWGDFTFARRDAPVVLPDAAAVVAAEDNNLYVEARVVPDLSTGVTVRKSKGSYGHRLHPVFGSRGKAWVMTQALHWHATIAHDLRFTGRLTRLGDLPFYDDLADSWSAQTPARRVIAPRVLRQALTSGAKEVAVADGDRVPLADDRKIWVAQTVPGKVSVTTYYTDDHPDEPSWNLALELAGIDIESSQGQGPSGETFLYRVRSEAGVEGVAAALKKAKLFAARAEPVVQTHEVPASALRVAEDGLVLGESDPVDWASIDLIEIDAPYPLDPDARVIIVSDRPTDFWYVYPLVILLALSGLLFLYVLIRPLVTLLSARTV